MQSRRGSVWGREGQCGAGWGSVRDRWGHCRLEGRQRGANGRQCGMGGVLPILQNHLPGGLACVRFFGYWLRLGLARKAWLTCLLIHLKISSHTGPCGSCRHAHDGRGTGAVCAMGLASPCCLLCKGECAIILHPPIFCVFFRAETVPPCHM